MATLYGGCHSPNSWVERSGNLSQIGAVGLSALDDGFGRLTRLLDCNSGSHLRFNGDRANGCHSTICTRYPARNNQPEDKGLGRSRSFGGFLATCGPDHILVRKAVAFLDHEGPTYAGVGA